MYEFFQGYLTVVLLFFFWGGMVILNTLVKNYG